MTTQTRPFRPSRFSAFKAIILCLLAGLFSTAFAEDWDGSTSKPSSKEIDGVEYYVITSPNELAWFAYQVNEKGESKINAILGNDIHFMDDDSLTSKISLSTIGISNTNVYDGIFDGANCSHIGGFIGCCLENTTETIENCLFAPASINTKSDGCQTWVRKYNSSILTIVNSYATRDFTGLVVIRTANDWTTFRDLVEAAQGQYDVDARLEADVNAGSIMVGFEDTYAYRGTFDGNGHTLTFNVYDHGRKFVGPFVNVGNATIMNLHTAGTITSSQMYATGLVAQVLNGTATIENCQSSVTVKGTMDGEGTLAGFVGRVTNSNVTIRNSKFDGRFEGDKCYGNAGFISWVDEKSSATIDNCLFNPDRISTKTDNNETWARKNASGSVTVTNSHAVRGMGSKFITIRNADDWKTFHDMTEVNAGKYWVDASLEADITTGLGIGLSEDTNWLGTFEGNGHTLNVDIGPSGGKARAVFCYVWTANIRDRYFFMSFLLRIVRIASVSDSAFCP